MNKTQANLVKILKCHKNYNVKFYNLFTHV